jgi:hypothetical protein
MTALDSASGAAAAPCGFLSTTVTAVPTPAEAGRDSDGGTAGDEVGRGRTATADGAAFGKGSRAAARAAFGEESMAAQGAGAGRGGFRSVTERLTPGWAMRADGFVAGGMLSGTDAVQDLDVGVTDVRCPLEILDEWSVMVS